MARAIVLTTYHISDSLCSQRDCHLRAISNKPLGEGKPMLKVAVLVLCVAPGTSCTWEVSSISIVS